jgi:SAM-dependent methyltransferase
MGERLNRHDDHPPLSPRRKWDQCYAELAPGQRLDPTPFVASCLADLTPEGWALDVAAGAGRHSLTLARHGWSVDAVDISAQGLRLARQRALESSLDNRIRFIVADVEQPWLPQRCYHLILVSFFLYRPLFPMLKAQLKGGGWLIYETFTVDRFEWVRNSPDGQRTRREFYLERQELRAAFSDLDIVFYEEGDYKGKSTARLLARKPMS